jgi:hypothetical protein
MHLYYLGLNCIKLREHHKLISHTGRKTFELIEIYFLVYNSNFNNEVLKIWGNLWFIFTRILYISFLIHNLTASWAWCSENLRLNIVWWICQYHVLILITYANKIILSLKWIINFSSVHVNKVLPCASSELSNCILCILWRHT